MPRLQAIGSDALRAFGFGLATGVLPSYELISTTALASAQSSVSFSVSAYAGTYKHLQVRMTVRTDRSPASDDRILYRFNSDTGSNYAYQSLRGNGVDVSSSDVFGTSATSMTTGRISAATGPSNYGAVILDIIDAFNTGKNKTSRSLSGATSPNYVSVENGLWMSTSAISSITFFPAGGTNIVSGSRFSLYGVRG